MKLLSALSLLLLLTVSTTIAQEVTPAPNYQNQFHRTQGWTGADGTYSYDVGNGSTLWTFSDTFFGSVIRGRRENYEFVNNSAVLQTGSWLNFLKAPTFRPPDDKGWFWMWDGILEGEFSVLLGQFQAVPSEVFGFKQIGLWHAQATLHPDSDSIKVLQYTKLPFFLEKDGETLTFGSAVCQIGPWHYILGIRDRSPSRSGVLARVPAGRLQDAGTWRFFDGQGWSREPWSSKPLFDGASMESSIHPTRDGGFLYIGGENLTDKIVARYASRPEGPWSEQTLVYTIPEVEGQIFAYNAKAHPHLTQGDKILISYNVNTHDLEQVIEEADIYRPRFIWWAPTDPAWVPVGDH